MRISVFGLGYVGTVCAACLSDLGHEIVGCDLSEVKVDLLGGGKAPIVEQDIDEFVGRAVREGRLTATTDAVAAVAATDISLICVGTPSRPNGSLDTSAVEAVAAQIGRGIKAKGRMHAVVVRSTVLPGTVRGRVLPILERETGGAVGETFGLASNPEFMREGTAVADFYAPPKTVVGEIDAGTADLLEALYKPLPGPFFRTHLEIAEMVKYADNVWHSVKVTFGNEVGAIAKAIGVDSHALMDIFCADEKLNISKAYLKPGFAFGGSCLPKDVRALSYFGGSLDLELPVISNLVPSNKAQVERGVEWILKTGAKKIAFMGFSFKSGTDDLRESPYVEVIERLIGKGCSIRIYDKNVHVAKLIGANRDYLLRVIPHISDLMVEELDDALADADIVVTTAKAPEYQAVFDRLKPGQRILDFARLPQTGATTDGYDGWLW